jgi:hypothetical protein
VSASVTREVGSGFDIALVIETSTSATEQLFVATKAAAVEFVLEQPPETRIALFASDPPALPLGYTADRAATVNAIKDLSRAPGVGLVAALDLAARTNDASHRVTIVAAATASDSTVSATALGDEPTASLRTGPSQLYAVGVVSDPLAQLAADTGGFARSVDTKQLFGAFDSVSADVAGRYRLALPVAPGATRVDVRVTAPEGTAAVSVPLSSGSAESASTSTTSPQNVDNGITAARSSGNTSDNSNLVNGAIVLGVVLVGLLAAFVALRLRRRAQLLSAPLAPATATAVAPRPPLPPPLPTVDLREADRLAPTLTPLTGYPLTALCDDDDIVDLRAAVESCGIVVSQVRTVDEALRDVVTGRARALFVDSAVSHARELAAAVRQRNEAGWSSCPTLVHDSHRGPPDPALLAMADAVIDGPVDTSHVVAALAPRP